RAVGQGYETGLAGLAADFGVDIDDDDAGNAEEVPNGAESGEQAGTTVPAVAQEQPAAPGLVPPPRPPGDEACPKKAARPRTAKKKVTVPKVARKSLADNETWQQARLFPVSALKSDR
ncbi:TerD family protein, partial [Streptomyces sp. TRM76130]|nr:TerD family protein [Streptomyces sp. TRM76130]